MPLLPGPRCTDVHSKIGSDTTKCQLTLSDISDTLFEMQKPPNPLQGQVQGCVREHAHTNLDEKQCDVYAQLQETAENCTAKAKMNPNP